MRCLEVSACIISSYRVGIALAASLHLHHSQSLFRQSHHSSSTSSLSQPERSQASMSTFLSRPGRPPGERITCCLHLLSSLIVTRCSLVVFICRPHSSSLVVLIHCPLSLSSLIVTCHSLASSSLIVTRHHLLISARCLTQFILALIALITYNDLPKQSTAYR